METNVKELFGRRFYWIFGVLILASVLSVGLMTLRVCLSGRLTHCFLVWNLFLAWLPLVFAFMAWQKRESRGVLFAWSLLWLLFFPNAPYLVTDLIHLRERPPVPFWFDIVLLQSFIWLGLLLGFISLYWMQSLVATLWSRRASWLFVLIVIGLTGFGIYLGRVQRWNSWDALLNPIDLTSDIVGLLFPPRRRSAGIFTMIYAAFLFVGYLLVYSLTHLRFELQTSLHNEFCDSRTNLTPEN